MTTMPTTPAPELGTITDMPLAASDAIVMGLPPAELPMLLSQPEAADQERSGIRVMLVEELEQVSSRIAELLAPDAHVRLVATVTEGGAALERIAGECPDVVIIDALLQGEPNGLQLARQLRASGMDTPIIFMTVPDRPVTLNPEMGVAEVLMLPFDEDALLGAITRVDEAHRGPRIAPPSGTIAVFSAAGGVGRTTIAHNLAVALARLPATRVALMDGDQLHGDMRLHLDAPEEAPSLLQMPTGHATDADLAPLLWQDPAGVDVLLAPPRMEQADLIMQSDIRRAISMLGRMHDVVVIDVPTVMDDTTLAILDDVDLIVDVIDAERGAVRKAQRCHDVLVAADFPMEKVVHVANRTRSGDTLDVAAEISRAIEASLPHDAGLAADELPVGASVVEAQPEAPLSRAVVELAEMLSARIEGDTGHLAARAA